MANNRIHYGIQQIGIAPDTSTSYTAVHGVQSFTMNTTFNLEQIFEYGQVAIYHNVENLPDIECTMTKVLDGYPLIWHLATRDAAYPTLLGRSNAKCVMALAIFDDTLQSATGTPIRQVQLSGMYVSSLTYTIGVDGPSTESVTLVGNDKRWSPTYISAGFTGDASFESNDDVPLDPNGVQTRERVLLNGTGGDPDYCLFPTDIPGITATGTNHNLLVHFQNIEVTANLGRTNLLEVGRRLPYHRYVEVPVEVTSSFTVISTSGDEINARESFGGSDVCTTSYSNTDQEIRLALCEGTRIYLGTKNRLSSVTYDGGDTTGGNVSVTYTYTNFNIFNVLHSGDPVGAFRPGSGTNDEDYLGA